MTLEEEKKLVAEKLMGWEIMGPPYSDNMFRSSEMKKAGTLQSLDHWNPHKDRNQLNEVEEKLNDKQRERYEFNLMAFRPRHISTFWWIRTVSTEFCFEILVKISERL